MLKTKTILQNLINYRKFFKLLIQINNLKKTNYVIICHLNFFSNLVFKLITQYLFLNLTFFLNLKIYSNLLKKNFFNKLYNYISNQKLLLITFNNFLELIKLLKNFCNYKIITNLLYPLYILNLTKLNLISINSINFNTINLVNNKKLINLLIIKNLKKLIYINFFKFLITKNF